MNVVFELCLPVKHPSAVIEAVAGRPRRKHFYIQAAFANFVLSEAEARNLFVLIDGTVRRCGAVV